MEERRLEGLRRRVIEEIGGPAPAERDDDQLDECVVGG